MASDCPSGVDVLIYAQPYTDVYFFYVYWHERELNRDDQACPLLIRTHAQQEDIKRFSFARDHPDHGCVRLLIQR